MLRISLEKLQNLLHTKLAGSTLATFDRLIGKLALLLLEIQDTLFDAVFDGDFVNDDVNFLGEAVHTIDGLFFYELRAVSLSYSRERK